MIFLAVVDLPRAVSNPCDACDEPARALLFTIGPPHWVERKTCHRELYPGGPDVFALCREHAAAARAMLEAGAEVVTARGPEVRPSRWRRSLPAGSP